MSLINSESKYQDLFGQNSATLNQDIYDLNVIDELTLEYVDANKNLVTDGDKKVITEDKDSFVDVPNQITFTQVGRQFTPALPQDIATNSDVEFKSVEVSDKVLFTGGAFNWDIYNNTTLFFRLNGTQNNFAMDSNFYPVGPGSQSLGTNSNFWGNAYLGSDVYLNGNLTDTHSNIYFDPTGNNGIAGKWFNQVRIKVDGTERFSFSSNTFIPLADNTYDLGNGSLNFKDIYLGTSIILNGTTLDSTQFNRLVAIDQDLTTTSDVSFNKITSATTLELPYNNSATPSLRFGNADSGINMTNVNTMRWRFNGGLRYVLNNTIGFYPQQSNARDLGTASQRWNNIYLGSNAYVDGNGEFNTTSSGYVSMRELRSVDYVDPPTDDVFVTMFGREQFLRTRASGSPTTNSGFMCSYLDTSNFYIYNSSLSGNLKISYNALLSGVGGGHSNATNCVDISTSGDITAQGEVLAPTISSKKTQTAQFEISVDNSNLEYTETITSANTWEDFDNIPTIVENNRNKFSISGSTLTYTGTDDRTFILNYIVNIRKTGAGGQQINVGINHNGSIISRTISEHRKASNDTSAFIGRCVLDVSNGDTLKIQVRNQSSNDNVIVSTWYFSAFDAHQNPNT